MDFNNGKRIQIQSINRLSSSLFIIAFLAALVHSQTVTFYETGEEFNGPFPSWKNVKTDYGAKGDGVTNDAAAINTAINALKNTGTNNYSVLYFPAGTYLINSMVANTGRVQGDEYSAMGIIGEDPATTIIKCNFTNGSMFQLDAWGLKVSRLTFNGNSKGVNGIMRTGAFGTYTEMSDLVFLDCATGLNLSTNYNAGDQGQAEHLIIRCQFIRCANGILANQYNSLDEWVWYCLFKDCGKGNDGVGGFQFYNNVFIGSTIYDISGGTNQASAMVNNISFNSKDFFTKNQSAPFYLQNNIIYNCTKIYAVPAANSVYANSCVWINNTQSTTAPATVELPATPPRVVRKIFEVTNAASIQTQIIAASSEPAGTKTVVHFPKSNYVVTSTISIPGNRDISLVGDGSFTNGTKVSGGAPTLKLLTPSRVTIQDMDFDGNPAIYVEVFDTSASRVRGRLFYSQGTDPTRLSTQALIVDSIEHADLMFIGNTIQYCQAGVVVRGGNDLGAGRATEGQVAFLSGSTGGTDIWNVQNGGKLIAQGFWDERASTTTRHLVDLTSSSKGSLTLACMRWAIDAPDNLSITIDNFNGVFTAVENYYTSNRGPGNQVGIKITGSGQNCNVFQGYSQFTTGTLAQNWIDQSSPDANAAFMNNGSTNVWKKVSGALPDTAAMNKYFALTRSLTIKKELACPAGVTDVKFSRVVASSNGGNAVRFVSKPPKVSVINTKSALSERIKPNFSVVTLGQLVKVPVGTSQIIVCDMQGRTLWNAAISTINDMNIAKDRIESICRQNMIAVKMVY